LPKSRDFCENGGSTSTFPRLTLRAIDEGLSFYKSTLSMRAPKIGASPLPGQALLPKKTLRHKVSVGKHFVRWANVCQGKGNELTDVLSLRGVDWRTKKTIPFLRSAAERLASLVEKILGTFAKQDCQG
jgi:hypothetical protein